MTLLATIAAIVVAGCAGILLAALRWADRADDRAAWRSRYGVDDRGGPDGL